MQNNQKRNVAAQRCTGRGGSTPAKLITLVLFLACMASCSATRLSCGVSGDASYVDLVNIPEPNARNLTELCSFNQEKN